MKKILFTILTLSALLATLPALAATYAALLPAHVRWVKEKMADGDYGDEVYQFFFYEPVSGYHYNALFYVDDGQPMLHAIMTDCQGIPNDVRLYKTYGYSKVPNELYSAIESSGFNTMPDYEGDGSLDIYYAHITAGNVSYVQINGFESSDNTAYTPLIRQVMEITRLDQNIKTWHEQFAIHAGPLQRDFLRGELGDEAFVLKSYSTWNSYERVIAIISIKDGKAVISGENGRRELTAAELARIKGFVDSNNFDSLPRYINPGVSDGGGYRYVHLTPEGTKYLQVQNAYMDTTRILSSGGEWIESYTSRTGDGSVYAELESMVKEIYEAGKLQPLSDSGWGIWDENDPPMNSLSVSVNGSAAVECVSVEGEFSAPLNKGLLDSLGIKRIYRPDMSTVVLTRGTKLLTIEPNQSFLTVVDAAGYDNPNALAAALASSDAYEKGVAKAESVGINVANGRMPLKAVCDAFGLSCEVNGGAINVSAPPTENLKPDYCKMLVGLLME